MQKLTSLKVLGGRMKIIRQNDVGSKLKLELKNINLTILFSKLQLLANASPRAGSCLDMDR